MQDNKNSLYECKHCNQTGTCTTGKDGVSCMTCVIDVDGIFNRLLLHTGANTLKELSLKNGYKKNWASNCRLKGVIPFNLCLKISKTYCVSLDSLILGNKDYDKKNTDKSLIKDLITNGFYRAEKKGFLAINENTNITDLSEMVMLKIGDIDI